MKNKIVKHFYVKESKKDKKGEAPIYLRINVNGKRSEIATNRRVITKSWDKNAEKVAGRSEQFDRFLHLGSIQGLLSRRFG